MTRTDRPKVYAIVGATSGVGRALVEHLTAAGHVVRPVARSAGVSIHDAAALRATFDGADGAYVMIPFDMQAEDLHASERAMRERLADAIAASRLRRVVLLSGLSAPLKRGTALGAALMEERLERLDLPELVHLRAGFFMENLVNGMGFVAQAATGVFSTPFRGDVPMPMVASSDVGDVAAELLTRDALDRLSVVELHGARAYTMTEATAVLGAAIGAPGVRYVQAPLAAAREGMLAAGVSPSFVDALIETARSFNAEEPWGDSARAFARTTLTTLETWAEQFDSTSASGVSEINSRSAAGLRLPYSSPPRTTT